MSLLAVLPADATLSVTFPKDGHYTLTVSGPKPAEILAGPLPVTGTKATVELTPEQEKKGVTVTVEDNDSGNAAVVPAPGGAKPVSVTVPANAFQFVSRTTVLVTDKKGQAPTVAAVTLTDGKGSLQTINLRPEDNGKASFQMVATGDGKVRVQQGGPNNQQTITVRIPVQHPKPVLELTADVALPDGMQTAGTAAGSAAAEGPGKSDSSSPPAPEPAKVRGGGLLSGLLGFLIALVLLGVAVVLAVRSLRGRGVTAASALAAAGVQLPDTPDDIPTVAAPAPEPIDPTVCPFCGARKEPNAPCPNCAVSSTPSTYPGAARPVTAGGGKRLVAVSGPRAGSIFPLTGPATIGRDPGRDIAIPEDTSLSRNHALVQPENGGAVVVDKGSSNGTWVNGHKITRQPLQPGDEIAAGSTRFRYEE